MELSNQKKFNVRIEKLKHLSNRPYNPELLPLFLGSLDCYYIFNACCTDVRKGKLKICDLHDKIERETGKPAPDLNKEQAFVLDCLIKECQISRGELVLKSK